METKSIVRPSEVTEDHLTYLDGLRESGVTNMFGAGSYLMGHFGLSKPDSGKVLSYWMKTFPRSK